MDSFTREQEPVRTEFDGITGDNSILKKEENKKIEARSFDISRPVPEGWSKIEADNVLLSGRNTKQSLVRSYQFDNFIDAFAFVSKVALVSEHRKHHPDIEFGYSYVSLSITTHSANFTLTPADYKLAEEINKVCESDDEIYIMRDLHGTGRNAGITRNLQEALNWKQEDSAYRVIDRFNVD